MASYLVKQSKRFFRWKPHQNRTCFRRYWQLASLNVKTVFYCSAGHTVKKGKTKLLYGVHEVGRNNWMKQTKNIIKIHTTWLCDYWILAVKTELSFSGLVRCTSSSKLSNMLVTWYKLFHNIDSAFPHFFFFFFFFFFRFLWKELITAQLSCNAWKLSLWLHCNIGVCACNIML